MNLWCKVGVSKIHGVGIIALKSIPMATIVTEVPSKYEKIQLIKYKKSECSTEQLEYLQRIHCYNPEGDNISLPETGFNIYWLQSFVNHSFEPNCIMYSLNGVYSDIITTKPIELDEEITIDFRKAYPSFYTKDKKWAKK